MKTPIVIAVSLALSFFVFACSDPEPVPADQCKAVVRHTRAIMGQGVQQSETEMLATCKTATDAQRGCAMAANSIATLLRCAH